MYSLLESELSDSLSTINPHIQDVHPNLISKNDKKYRKYFKKINKDKDFRLWIID